MKARFKLISTIVAMCLVITLGVFGILAVKTLNMSVGGNITFSADGLSLEVSQGVFKTTGGAEYTGITTQTDKLQAFAIDTNTKLGDIQDKIDSWTNLDLYLDSKGDAVLHFSVTNKMTTPLFVYIATELGTNTNENMDLVVSQSGVPVEAGQTKSFEITFDILDTSINAGLTGFVIDVDFEKSERPLPKAQYKIDTQTGLETTEIDYYYVEMGTYNGKPVRWRYVASRNGTKYDGTSDLLSMSGYYILETEIPISIMYLSINKFDVDTYKHTTEGYTHINANDYGLSDIRAYLTNTGSGGFMDVLGISEDNEIYQMIKPRSLIDLYSKIRPDGKGIDKTNTKHSLSLTGDKDISSQSDKFWILSQQESLAFFKDNKSRIWGGGTYYWLRTPLGSTGGLPCSITVHGEISNHRVDGTYGTRPAFKI